MAIKSWSCPSCRRDFIVDAESARDTCPWCHAVVEEADGTLRVASDDQPTGEVAAPSTAATDGHAANAEAVGTGSGSQATGTQSWWPFEYSS